MTLEYRITTDPSFFIACCVCGFGLEKPFLYSNSSYFLARLPGGDLMIILFSLSSYVLTFSFPAYIFSFQTDPRLPVFFVSILLCEFAWLQKFKTGEVARLSRGCLWTGGCWFSFAFYFVILAFIQRTKIPLFVFIVLAALVRSGVHLYHGLCLNQKFADWIGYRRQE